MAAAMYAVAALLYFSLSIDCQPLIDEHEFLERFPSTNNLNREVFIENSLKQLSLIRIQESDENLKKSDINAGNTCEEGQERKLNDNNNECNVTVFEYPFRLVGGVSEKEGRLEVYMNGQWGTVCDEGWDVIDARVVCQSLGFIGHTIPLLNATFGEGTGPIWMSSVNCSGREYSIKKCGYKGKHRCSHSNDAGVRCTDDGIRLVNGKSWRGGRVEVHKDGEWGTVCDDGWGDQDASVVCRAFGLLGNAAYDVNFGEGTGSVVLGNVRCNGTESSFWKCKHSSPSSFICWSSKAAGVKCFEDSPIRLVGGKSPTEGRVEVYLNGQWGTVCDTSFDTLDAKVLCNSLDYGQHGLGADSSVFGQGRGTVWLNNLRCYGGELSVLQCSQSRYGKNACHHSRDVGIVCMNATNNLVRLVGGNSKRAGRVEVLVNNQWGGVCDFNWDREDASVVCRSLGYTGFYIPTSKSWFGGSESTWLSNSACRGNEPSLLDCPHNLIGRSCHAGKTAGVICTNQTTVRIVNGVSESKGMVEVYLDGQWGYICGEEWDYWDARVVCRDLGYSGYSVISSYPISMNDTRKIFISTLDCSGNEDSIWLCDFPNIGTVSCPKSNVAGILCTNESSYELRLVNGSSENEGRVEIFINKEWGTICGQNRNSARIICRHLGYSGLSSLTGNNVFGKGLGRIWISNLTCDGSEKSLLECGKLYTHNHCSHEDDEGVLCHDSTSHVIRLVNGSSDNEGRPEIYVNGKWGGICSNKWSPTESYILCKSLGYFGHVPSEKGFGPGTEYIWMHNVSCNGRERHILECDHSINDQRHCENGSVGIICSNSSKDYIRLVNGKSENEGRLEVYHNGEWGTVCDDDWDLDDTKVVCRSLGYTGPVNKWCCAHFGSGSGPIVLGKLKCTGEETSLFHCKTETFTCSHWEDVGVKCT